VIPSGVAGFASVSLGKIDDVSACSSGADFDIVSLIREGSFFEDSVSTSAAPAAATAARGMMDATGGK